MNVFPTEKTHPGFTLIEILITLVVAAIVLPALILPLVEGIRDLEKPAALITMVFLAQEEMESRIIGADYDKVSSWPDTAIAGFPGYTSSCAVSQTAEGIREATVTVSRGDDSLNLTTLKTDWRPE